ncbi:hypothetical protein GCM10010350_36360 [Streptomyces galilaeus]|nr:hypothetical protein GCM10010350_36360 [Streptomyces galilaeus]
MAGALGGTGEGTGRGIRQRLSDAGKAVFTGRSGRIHTARTGLRRDHHVRSAAPPTNRALPAPDIRDIAHRPGDSAQDRPAIGGCEEQRGRVPDPAAPSSPCRAD